MKTMKTMHATILRQGIGRRSRPACSAWQARLGLAALLALTLAAGTAHAQSSTWTQTGPGTFTWGEAANWTSGAPNATGAVASLNVNLSGSQTINLDQAITTGTLNIGDTTSTFSGVNIAAGTGGSLIMDVTSGSAMISKATSTNTIQDVISASVQLNDNLLISNAGAVNASTATLNLSGVISESGGARSISITGGGNTMLSGVANTYTGKTTLINPAGNPRWLVTKLANAGEASSFGMPTGANATIDMHVSNNGLQYMGTTDSTTDRSINLTGGGGRYTLLTSTASTTLTFNSDFQSSFTSNSTLWFDGYVSSSGARAGKIVVNGKLVDSPTRSLSITVDDFMNTDFVTLTGLSTFTGTTTVTRNAILTVNSIKDLGQASALGAPTTADAGRIRLGGSLGTSTLRYNGTGDTTNREVQLNSDTDGRGGRIEMAGSGTLKFTSNVISAGANSALLTLQGSTSGVGEIAGIISSATAAGKTTSLVKSGTGTWVLSGNNTYTGTTSVSAGRLFINGNQSSATGAVTVAAGATLGGNGTIGGTTTFSGASLLRPGSNGTDTGVLSFGKNLTLSTTGTSFIDITGATRGSLYDGVNVSGTLAYGGRLQFAIASLITGTFDIFNFTGGLSSGSFASIAGSISGTTLSFTNASGVWTAPFTIGSTSGTATFTQSTGDLVIVPEPGAWALAVVGCSGLVWLASRRRRTKAVAP